MPVPGCHHAEPCLAAPSVGTLVLELSLWVSMGSVSHSSCGSCVTTTLFSRCPVVYWGILETRSVRMWGRVGDEPRGSRSLPGPLSSGGGRCTQGHRCSRAGHSAWCRPALGEASSRAARVEPGLGSRLSWLKAMNFPEVGVDVGCHPAVRSCA